MKNILVPAFISFNASFALEYGYYLTKQNKLEPLTFHIINSKRHNLIIHQIYSVFEGIFFVFYESMNSLLDAS